jgi:hypothetical protein
LPANVTLPSPINTNQNFIDTEKRGSKNKYKSSSTSSNGKKQTGRGFLWKTKKFFKENPAILKSILLLLIAFFFLSLEYLFKLTNNPIFQKIIKEEKNKVDFLLNQTLI